MSDPISVSVAEAVTLTGLSRSLLYLAIRERRLPVRKVGRRTIILVTDLRSYLEGLPTSRAA